MDESKLLSDAARGDAAAFGSLFERYARDVFQLAVSMGHRGGDAEDLMQDTFLAAFEGIGRFERRSTFKTWLLSILFRQSGRRRRYDGIRAMEVFDEAVHAGSNGNARLQAEVNHEARLDLHAMLETLSPEHRSVLVLRELQGLSYDEIAETLNIPRGTVESRLFRARNILRDRFHEYGGRRPAYGARRKPEESRHE